MMNTRLLRKTVWAAFAGAAAGMSLLAAPADELFEKAIYTEETRGELRAAANLYEQVINDPAAARSLTAQAQLRLGLCELKLGDKPRAISALEKLTQDFPTKEGLLGIIGQRMPSLLDEMLNQIGQNYIAEVDRAGLVDTALRAILGKLDSTSSFLRANDLAYISAEELRALEENMAQKIGGIGALLRFDPETAEVVISTPLPNSPALKAGVRANDRVAAVDDMALPKGKELETARKWLRGAVGTPVTARLKRGQDLLDVRMVREIVQLASARGRGYNADHSPNFMVDEAKKIGYVRLSQLGSQSEREVKTALDRLKSDGVKGLILDLRNNGGGLLDGAIQITDLFLEDGAIVTVRGRSTEKAYSAGPGSLADIPIAVLVNRNTASAAEIIVAALQDHGRAKIVGERTYGQALVKSLITLKDGAGALKLPVAAYFRPNGKNMNRYPDSASTDDWGVKPDEGFEVVVAEGELQDLEKDFAAREVLTAKAQTDFKDRQLDRALEWLNAGGKN